MPFAPVALRSRMSDCFSNLETAEYAANFMTVCCDCRPEFVEKCPAVVHVDGTARPQLVDSGDQSGLHSILSEYERLTGIPALINTSFNIHEEPIVCSSEDAMRAFVSAKLDFLALGNYLVWRPDAEKCPPMSQS